MGEIMNTQEILNICYKFLKRMNEKRPDLYERVTQTSNGPEIANIVKEFLDWEVKQNGR